MVAFLQSSMSFSQSVPYKGVYAHSSRAPSVQILSKLRSPSIHTMLADFEGVSMVEMFNDVGGLQVMGRRTSGSRRIQFLPVAP